MTKYCLLRVSAAELHFKLGINTRDRDRGRVRTMTVTELDPDLLLHRHFHRAVAQVNELKLAKVLG